MLYTQLRNAFAEDKRRLDNRITQLEEELEEEQANNEQNNEKLRKLQSDYDKVLADLHLEKANVVKAEVSIFVALYTHFIRPIFTYLWYVYFKEC